METGHSAPNDNLLQSSSRLHVLSICGFCQLQTAFNVRGFWVTNTVRLISTKVSGAPAASNFRSSVSQGGKWVGSYCSGLLIRLITPVYPPFITVAHFCPEDGGSISPETLISTYKTTLSHNSIQQQTHVQYIHETSNSKTIAAADRPPHMRHHPTGNGFRRVRPVAKKRLLASSCQFVRPNVSERLPLREFQLHLVLQGRGRFM
jgi:hypothetical protein